MWLGVVVLVLVYDAGRWCCGDATTSTCVCCTACGVLSYTLLPLLLPLLLCAARTGDTGPLGEAGLTLLLLLSMYTLAWVSIEDSGTCGGCAVTGTGSRYTPVGERGEDCERVRFCSSSCFTLFEMAK